MEVLSWIDQDFNIFESLIKFLQVLKMKMEMVQNKFDSFDKFWQFGVICIFEEFGGFGDF